MDTDSLGGAAQLFGRSEPFFLTAVSVEIFIRERYRQVPLTTRHFLAFHDLSLTSAALRVFKMSGPTVAIDGALANCP